MIVRTALNENLAKIFGSANRKLTVFRSDCFPFCVVLLLCFISLISSIYTFNNTNNMLDYRVPLPMSYMLIVDLAIDDVESGKAVSLRKQLAIITLIWMCYFRE